MTDVEQNFIKVLFATPDVQNKRSFVLPVMKTFMFLIL